MSQTKKPSSGPVFNKSDFDRAIAALEFFFQNNAWPPGDARLKQSKIVNALRDRDVTQALAVALLDDLISRGVFQEGERFARVNPIVALDGSWQIEGRPMSEDRYLRTTREKWYGYLAKRARATPDGAGSLLKQDDSASDRFTDGPFGLQINHNAREATRGDTKADFGGSKIPWFLFLELCARPDDFYARPALATAAWAKAEAITPDDHAFYVQINVLNSFLKRMGIEAWCKRHVGYRLRELPERTKSAKKKLTKK
jgi:hypothetical protein